MVVAEDESSDSIRPEDEEFVNSLTSEQLKFFTSSDLNDLRTPLEEAKRSGLLKDDKEDDDDDDDEESDEKEEVEVDAVRAVPVGWEAEAQKLSLLPVKKKDGTVSLPVVTAEDVEERRQLEERREARKKQAAADAASGQSKRRRKLGDAEDPAVIAAAAAAAAAKAAPRALSKAEATVQDLKAFQERLDRIPNKQKEIETLSTNILANPEENLSENARLLLALCVDDDAVVKQLALLSSAAVFADLMPGYRIREDNEERVENTVLSKDVKKLRRYERVYLHSYRQFVDLLVTILTLRKPNPATAEELTVYAESKKQRHFHVNTVRALHQLQVIAIKAVGRIFLSNPSFNCADSLVKIVVRSSDAPEVAGGAMSKLAVQTIVKVFEQRNELEQIAELVLEIGRYVKSKKFSANPDLLRTFLQLNISDAVSDIDIKTASDRGDRKAKKQHVSKREKKVKKFGKMVDSKIREGEAERRRSEVQRFQRQMAQSMFLTYFRVLKTASNSPLLPAVLEGVARWCHLLNIDFMFEIVHALLKLLQQASLPLHSSLYCAITAFQALRNAGDVFRIDLSAYYHFVYPRLLQVPLVAGPSDESDWSERESVEEVAIRCLQLMLSSKTYRMANRSAAFAKRLATMSVHSVPGASIGFLQLCRRIIASDSRLEQLLDPEDGGTADVFNPEVEDPDNCNPFSTSLFELLLLQTHYHPHVALFANQMLKNAPVSPHDPKDYCYSYDWKVQIFNPPLEEPGPTRFDKKLRKLAKYDDKKKAKFAASLVPVPPASESQFTRKSRLSAARYFGKQ